MKLLSCGLSALFAAVLALQAQTTSAPPTSGSTGAGPAMNPSGTMNTSGSTNGSGSTMNNQTSGPMPSTNPTAGSDMQGMQSNQSTIPAPNTATTQSFSGTTTAPGTAASGTQFNNAQSKMQQTTQSTFAGVVPESQITTVVQQLDAEGPAIVQHVTTQVGEVACSPQTVENLVHALHDGTAVTLTAKINGQPQSATFTPTGPQLGYGEAYIALALAAQELRNAGVASCATPDQWQAVLDGGSLNSTSTVTTTGASTQFPGILVLRSQGQGWGQIAQTSNVQLGQVIAGASNSVNTNSPSPTGYSSAEFNRNQNAAPEKKDHRKYYFFGPREDKGTNNQASGSENQSTNNQAPASENQSTTNPPAQQQQPTR